MSHLKELRKWARNSDWNQDLNSDQQNGVPAPDIFPEVPADAELFALPSPELCPGSGRNLQTIIRERRSIRKYSALPMTQAELSYLLYCSHGFVSVRPGQEGIAALRTVPSAGCRHPIDTYLAILNVDGLPRGLYRFLPREHALLLLSRDDGTLTERVSSSLCGQMFAAQGSAVFYWVSDMYRCEWRYTHHAHKLALLDVGHVCQNLYLAAGEVGSGVCALDAYQQTLCDELFALDGDNNFVLYAASVGRC